MARIFTEPLNNEITYTQWGQLIQKTIFEARGFISLGLTNLNNSAAPQIEYGSRVEVSGSLYLCEATETVTGSPQLGVNYIYCVTAGSVASFSYSTYPPTWNAVKGGWYNGENRAVAVLYYYGGAYYSKMVIDGAALPVPDKSVVPFTTGTLIQNVAGGQTVTVTLDPGEYIIEIAGAGGGGGGNSAGGQSYYKGGDGGYLKQRITFREKTWVFVWAGKGGGKGGGSGDSDGGGAGGGGGGTAALVVPCYAMPRAGILFVAGGGGGGSGANPNRYAGAGGGGGAGSGGAGHGTNDGGQGGGGGACGNVPGGVRNDRESSSRSGDGSAAIEGIDGKGIGGFSDSNYGGIGDILGNRVGGAGSIPQGGGQAGSPGRNNVNSNIGGGGAGNYGGGGLEDSAFGGDGSANIYRLY
jgi:hypothetical protein